jgi:hypothetical protein
VVSDDLVKQALAELNDIVRCRCHAAYTDRKLHDPDCNCDSAEALQIVSGRIEALQAQLAKAREDALREAANFIRVKQAKQKMACVVWPEEILALLDTPTPAPSPDALVKAALEYLAESFEKFSPTAAKVMRDLSNHPATVAAIIERAGK